MSTIPEKTCSAEGCSRPHKARGLCSMHYKRWRTKHSPRICTVADCKKTVMARGWCSAHYKQWSLYGDPTGHAPKEPSGESLPGEEWRPAIEFEGLYEVSNRGRVRRTTDAPNGRYTAGYIMSPAINPDGYFRASLSRDGIQHYRSVHRLVAFAFIPNPDGKPQINHISGDKTDNRPENLEWCTAQENIQHRFRVLGHKPLKGSRHGMARLTADQVRAIRAAHAAGQAFTALAEEYGVVESAIRNIVNRRRWKHI